MSWRHFADRWESPQHQLESIRHQLCPLRHTKARTHESLFTRTVYGNGARRINYSLMHFSICHLRVGGNRWLSDRVKDLQSEYSITLIDWSAARSFCQFFEPTKLILVYFSKTTLVEDSATIQETCTRITQHRNSKQVKASLI